MATPWRSCRAFIDAILEGTLTPSSWKGHGPLPTHVDGWRQTQVDLRHHRLGQTAAASCTIEE